MELQGKVAELYEHLCCMAYKKKRKEKKRVGLPNFFLCVTGPKGVQKMSEWKRWSTPVWSWKKKEGRVVYIEEFPYPVATAEDPGQKEA